MQFGMIALGKIGGNIVRLSVRETSLAPGTPPSQKKSSRRCA